MRKIEGLGQRHQSRWMGWSLRLQGGESLAGMG